MSATFQSLAAVRQPKAVKAIELLSNLARYDHAEHEAKALVNSVADALDAVDHVFAKKWGWLANDDLIRAEPEPEPTQTPTATLISHVPPGTADGGASFEAEIRWAVDAIRRGQYKLAEARLKLILKGE